MPTYEYVCEKCEKTFDYFQSMNDARLTECIFEGCDGKVKRKLGTGAGIIFKGSGFYETDYRSDSYKEAKKSDSSSGESGGASDSKKSGGSSSSEGSSAGSSGGEKTKPSTGSSSSPSTSGD